MCEHEPTQEEIDQREAIREIEPFTGELTGFDPAPGPIATAIMNTRESLLLQTCER